MKERMRKLTASLGIVLALGMITGCGNGKGEYASSDMVAPSAYNTAAGGMDGGIYEAEASVAEEGVAEQESVGEIPDQQNRKLIKTVDMSVETEEFDTLLDNVRQRVSQLGGYIEQSNIYNGSYTSNYRSRNADLTARIPAARLEEFVTDVAAQSNVTNKSEYVEDVTLQYVDLESHKKALRAEEESLLAMLEKAESLEDVITIQTRLTDVRYQLESMEAQLRTYDNKIDYSTVHLYVDEVAQYTPYEPKTAGERISEGFMRNLHNVGDGLKNFFIELIIALPILVTFAVIIGVIIAFVFVVIRVSDKRARKRKEQMQARMKERERETKPDGNKQV